MNINKILRYICLVGIFIIPFTPLLVANSLFFPFITGKGFFFRIVTEIMFCAWAVLAISDSTYRPKKSWIVWAFAAFVAVMAIADAFSVNPFKSFWSNFERMEGWITLAHLFAYFLVLGTVLTRDLWDAFLQTWLGVGLVTIVYSLLQTAGLIRINQGGVRTDATFGNAAYLGIFSIFMAFIALLFLVRSRTTFNARSHTFIFYGFNVGFIFFVLTTLNRIAAADKVGALVGWSIAAFLVTNILLAISSYFKDSYILYGLLAIGEVVLVYNTQTRGSLIGLVAGLGIAAILIAIFEKQHKVLRTSAISLIAAIVIIVGVFFAIKDTNFVKGNATLHRLASISLNDPTTQSRFILWGMAYDGFKENPKTVLIGWGQESFNHIFNKYYDPRMYAQEQWFDRAHDVFFDWLTAGGIFGLGTYLSVFGITIWYIWRKDSNTFSHAEKSILTGVLVAYFVNNVFVFDNIVSYLMYFGIIGYVYSRRTHIPLIATEKKTVYENRILLPLGAVVLVAAIYFVNVPALQANLNLIKSITPQEGVNPYPQFQKTLAIKSFGIYESREQLYSITSQLITGVQQSGTADASTTAALQQFVTLVDTETAKQLAATPNDPRYYVLPASVYDLAGDPTKAVELLEKASALSPKKQSILFQLASAYLTSGNTAKAEETLKKAYELETSNQNAKILYATGALYNKNFQVATDLLKDVPDTEVAASDQIMHALYYSGQYQQLINLWKIRVQETPSIENRVSLAAAYLLVNDKQNAIAQIEASIQQDPSFKEQGEAYIKQIQTGALN